MAKDNRSYGGGSSGDASGFASKRTIFTRFHYWFDNTLARGPQVLIFWLLVAAFIGSLPFFIYLQFRPEGIEASGGGSSNDNLFNAFWGVLGKGGFPNDHLEGRIFSIFMTLASLATGGAMFAFINSTMTKKLNELRKGKGPVVLDNHVIIYGWGPQAIAIINEIDVANQGNPGVVVVLAPTAQETMLDEVHLRLKHLKNTKVVVRSVDPSNPKVLQKMSASHAKSIIILGTRGIPTLIASVLSTFANLPETSPISIIADVNDAAIANALSRSTLHKIITVESLKLIGEVAAQAAIQPGLAAIFLDLLDFEGNEIHLAPAGKATGTTFGDALLAFESASLFGLLKKDGTVALFPDMSTKIEESDQLVAIANTEKEIKFRTPDTTFPDVLALKPIATEILSKPTQTLIIGWSPIARDVMETMSEHTADGSTALVLAQPTRVTADDLKGLGDPTFVVTTKATSGSYDELAALLPGTAFDRVLIFGYRGKTTPIEADAQTLVALLSVHTLKRLGAFGEGKARVIAEVIDSNNVELARVADIEDLVISDRLTALMMAQLSQTPGLNEILKELFNNRGNTLAAKPINNYVENGLTSYAKLVAAGRARGEVIIGYRNGDPSLSEQASIVLNPSKRSSFDFKSGDRAIVIGPIEK